LTAVAAINVLTTCLTVVTAFAATLIFALVIDAALIGPAAGAITTWTTSRAGPAVIDARAVVTTLPAIAASGVITARLTIITTYAATLVYALAIHAAFISRTAGAIAAFTTPGTGRSVIDARAVVAALAAVAAFRVTAAGLTLTTTFAATLVYALVIDAALIGSTAGAIAAFTTP